jgi:hypothetical protein
MKKTKQIYDEVYQELIKDFKISEIEERPRTFDEIETFSEAFGEELKRRILERVTQNHAEDIDKKKL